MADRPAGIAAGVGMASAFAPKVFTAVVGTGVGQLPPGTSFAQIAGVALLGGIGFTMAIFIAELAFAIQPEFLLMAKTGILLASLVAGIGGLLWLYLLSKRTTENE